MPVAPARKAGDPETRDVFGFFTGPRVAFGPGAFEQLTALPLHRVLLVVDPEIDRLRLSLRLEEEVAKVTSALARVVLARTEPSIDSVEIHVADGTRFRPDTIIAVGGGSTIDAGRALWVRLEQPNTSLASLSPLSDLQVGRSIRFIAVPTTCGSGAEMGWSIHLRNGEGRLLELAHRDLVADWVLLDPALPASLPSELVAETGIDALAHALEAIASEWATPFTDALAREAAGRLLVSLPRWVRHPGDDETRASVQLAASMAGLAVANAQFGVIHALAHALGPSLGIPHGRAVAHVLPAAVEFNFPAARDRYEKIASSLCASAVQSRAAIGDRMRALLESVNRPVAGPWEEPGARIRESLDLLVTRTQLSTGVVANPRVPSAEEIRRLLVAVADGTRVDF